MDMNQGNAQQYQEAVKCQELPYNHEETLKVEKLAVYQRFKQWLKDHGVLVDPRVRYPSYFGSANKGVVGVSVSKAIEKRRAIIAVPYQLLITVDKVKEDIDLFEIVKDNINFFKGDDDAAMKLLVLFLSSELIKGQKSIYYPYFAIESEVYLRGWDSKSLQMLENRNLMKTMREQKENMELQFMNFLRIFRRYENIFPQKLTNSDYKDIYEKAYIFIVTRAFGWSLPSISLIPLADSFNHSNIRYVNHFLVNIDEEKQCKGDLIEQTGYKAYRKEVNLSILKDQFFELKQQELAQLRKEKKSKVLKFVQKHKDIVLQSEKLEGKAGEQLKINPKNKAEIRNKQNHILYQQYRAGVHKLKNLHFYESSCDEDNDTDEDDVFDNELVRQKFILDDKERQISEVNKKKQIKKLWKIYFKSEDEGQSSEEQKQMKGVNKQLKEQITQKLLKQNDSSEISYDDSEDSDDPSWNWTNKANHKKSYFIMSTRQIVRQNQQIYNFYGRRSNRFLLSNYNFLLKDNIYDSYPLSIKLDEKITSKSVSKMLLFAKKEDNELKSRELYLKRFRINVDLINICRSYIVLWTKKEWINGRLIVPFDREIQTKALELYQEIIKFILKEYSTSAEEDEELEQQQKIKYQQRAALMFRQEYKKILRGQEVMICKCLLLLKRWQLKGDQKIDQSEMCWLRRLRPYLNTLEESTSL